MDLPEPNFDLTGMTDFERLQLAVDLWKAHGRPPHHGQATEAVLSAIARHPRVLDDLLERERQIHQEGWTSGHDDEHALDGSMAKAGGCYALAAAGVGTDWVRGGIKNGCALFWPWARQWFKPKDAVRDLVRARALLLADLEQRDRAIARASGDL